MIIVMCTAIRLLGTSLGASSSDDWVKEISALHCHNELQLQMFSELGPYFLVANTPIQVFLSDENQEVDCKKAHAVCSGKSCHPQQLSNKNPPM
jgi:hypothetical protein